MMKKSIFGVFLWLLSMNVMAQDAVVRINAETQYQKITGFGGFVCSPQFGYNHMSQSDIKKVWGAGSTVGCNIMRLYIPIGRNAWSQSLQTAKWAKQMGLIVFASPWGQPAEWKTNGTSNAKNSDGTTGKLKKENWPDYAQYLEDYVVYLRNNGVELDAISIQNEPDWPAEYAGCLWSASEIADFVKTYGSKISCKVMAPETLAISDNYANALNNSSVLPCFDIYGGHLYGGMQSAFKKLAQKGKEIWMTEYLINWNENQPSNRNFDWNKDVFNFARSINDCMLNDFNAWIHYAAKRYYGMLGDGTNGTSSGVVTKRGYVMAHFARYVTGMTRVEASWTDEGAQALEGSAFISQQGDTMALVVFNASNENRSLKLDLPFYSVQGKIMTTTKSKSMAATDLNLEEESCRPVVDIQPSSVNTILFYRSRSRVPSQMTGSVSHFNKIEDMSVTKTNFGTSYKLTGKTVKFDHSNSLLSRHTDDANGYIQLDDRYTQLVMRVKKVSSTLNYTSALTTLYYINAKGEVASHDYGELDLNRRENFNLIFDLSPTTLTDGCCGLIAITNNNWSSTLTITFGDVYFENGKQYAASLSGAFTPDDSYWLDFSEDASCTSIDMASVTQLSENIKNRFGNRVFYLPEGFALSGCNGIVGDACDNLVLTEDGGDFRPQRPFNTTNASFSCLVKGFRMMMIPFVANVPEGVKAYRVTDDFQLQTLQTIEAHQPVLIEAEGLVTFQGQGDVAFVHSPLTAPIRGSYVSIPLFAGDYVLKQVDGQWGFAKIAEKTTLTPFDAYLQQDGKADFIPFDMSQTGIRDFSTIPSEKKRIIYNVMGQRVNDSHRGLVIIDGRKWLRPSKY